MALVEPVIDASNRGGVRRIRAGKWAVGWDDHRRRRTDAFASTTPARWIARLEGRIEVARCSGALPRPRDPWSRDDPRGAAPTRVAETRMPGGPDDPPPAA